jgi:hypothetical protein
VSGQSLSCAISRGDLLPAAVPGVGVCVGLGRPVLCALLEPSDGRPDAVTKDIDGEPPPRTAALSQVVLA